MRAGPEVAQAIGTRRKAGHRVIMRKKLWVVGSLALSLASAGCSESAFHAPDSEGNVPPSAAPPAAAGQGSAAQATSQSTGSVGMQLTLPAGQTVQVVQWKLTGPNNAATVVQTGSVNISNSPVVSFLVGGVPAGSNYQIALTGTAIDGSVTCVGSATFNVVGGTTTNVSVALGCNVATMGAQVTLGNGATFDCGVWNNVIANPTETTVGGASIAVAATATGPNPSALTYSWSAPSGTFDTPNAANANFACTTAGTVPLTLTVGDGPVPQGASCNAGLTTKTISVKCDQSQITQVPAMPVWALLLLTAAMGGIGLGMRRARSARLASFLFVAGGACTAIEGCSSQSDGLAQGEGQSSRSSEAVTTGTIDLSVKVPTGITLNSANYTLVGPNSFSQTGTITISHTTAISATITGVPAGSGYTISLVGISADGSSTCAGTSNSFTVVAGNPTSVPTIVTLSCNAPSSVGVNGSVAICPTIDSVSANPLSVSVGNSVALSTVARGPDPSGLSYSWSATTGTFVNGTTAAPSFTCTTSGSSVITVTVSDGSDAAGCPATDSLTITCTP